MEYIAALQTFVMTVLFDKGDYNFKHKNFKPIKVMVMFALIGNIWFTAYLLNTIYRIQQLLEKECPTLLDKKTTQELPLSKKETV